ncbi:type II toxin-antitoxin system HicA family toxin [Fusibacter ferrireducens]|uniref:Type II toxin-antitoxin system HicA family toxin n=1 Tax=Fusibacter ferrireducens TaxID=2785058 RepID=A0ABS0A045_9FIRM|nr:type II toxin-antitoxin system HicA family toxin [Fusibacter ferrireducens]MBF4696068.1 type II toxin-antitoxin system HicA family toxin [Fusibacter ferrireducens]
MGSKYPILTPKEIIRALEKIGFQKVSQKGSHAKYKNQSFPVRVVIIPIHSEIARGTLKSILEQANISLDDFLNLL